MGILQYPRLTIRSGTAIRLRDPARYGIHINTGIDLIENGELKIENERSVSKWGEI